MKFVLDASVTCTWCLQDERSTRGDQILKLCSTAFAIVPALWITEVTNALWVAERRNRVAPPEVDRFLRRLSFMNIRVRPNSIPDASSILALARAEQLTVYDAAYLHLAERSALPLATFDDALARAATHRNIPLL